VTEFEKTGYGLRTFICRCDEDGSMEADILLRQVRDVLGEKVEASNFLTCVAYNLWHRYGASLSIDCDQWFLVSGERYTDEFRVNVECDEAEDGIAAVWIAFHDMRKDEDERTASAKSAEKQDPQYPET
jgi:hypothetical protein